MEIPKQHMGKVVSIEEAVELSKKLKLQNKQVVLAGGCFDILHAGHIRFLEEAKKQGDVLFILLESDASVRHSKGNSRPINNQSDRALVLAALEPVDSIVLLPLLKTDAEYDRIVSELSPNVIAATQNDPFAMHKERQAKQIGGKFVYVIKRVPDASSTKITKLLHEMV